MQVFADLWCNDGDAFDCDRVRVVGCAMLYFCSLVEDGYAFGVLDGSFIVKVEA
jgi:hypothetical protein